MLWAIYAPVSPIIFVLMAALFVHVRSVSGQILQDRPRILEDVVVHQSPSSHQVSSLLLPPVIVVIRPCAARRKSLEKMTIDVGNLKTDFRATFTTELYVSGIRSSFNKSERKTEDDTRCTIHGT